METVEQASDRVVVRRLRPDDLERVVRLDAKVVGRERAKYYELILERNLRETGIQVSLAAEVEREFAGFLLARAWYGEFGSLEPVAVLEAIAVHPHYRGQGVGTALIEQLATNLRALGLNRLRTAVDWPDLELLAFFHERGFAPAQTLLLERDLSARRPDAS
jgi:ribosomal protein S18 acetylase RimI-like enzyme